MDGALEKVSKPADGRSGWRILIAGTGGQGVITCARLLSDSFVELGHEVVSGQLHGMAQRGGAVQSTVMIDAGASPVIPRGRADFVLGFEPVETARALPFMSRGTVVYMNTVPVVPYVLAQQAIHNEGDGKYPDIDGMIERVRATAPQMVVFDATASAAEAGSVKAMNIVMLGCLLGSGALPCVPERFWDKARSRIPQKLVEINARAFNLGVRAASFSPRGVPEGDGGGGR